MLLFRFVGSFLLRSEARTFLVLLFHEPPRTAREPKKWSQWSAKSGSARQAPQRIRPLIPAVRQQGNSPRTLIR